MRLWIVETSPNYALDAERNLYTTDGDGAWYANGAQLTAGDALCPPELGEQPLLFETHAEFLTADPHRLRSPERGYGMQWREGGSNWVTHRVSYLHVTGELYAAALAGPTTGRVELLACFPVDECSECDGSGAPQDPLDGCCRPCLGTGSSCDLAERVLDGWQDVCGTPGSLEWVRERVYAHEVAA